MLKSTQQHRATPSNTSQTDRSIQQDQQQKPVGREGWPTTEQKQYGEMKWSLKRRQIKGKPQVTSKGLNTPPAVAFCCT